MKTYKVLIKKCDNSQSASAIASEVARFSGTSADVVYNALVEKAICIRREAGEDEARNLAEQFGRLGAAVELIPIRGIAAVAPAAPAMPPEASAPAIRDDDDDDDEESGRLLSDEEYAQMCQRRSDIFYIEKDSRLRNTELVCLIVAVAIGVFLSTRTVIAAISPDFLEPLNERTIKRLITIDKPEELDKKPPEEQLQAKTETKTLKPRSAGVSQSTGGGDVRSRITKQGVLGIVSGQIKGRAIQTADVFGKGGFATDIDAIISGVGGLKSRGDGGVGLRGEAGIGHGFGFGSGFGGPGGPNINDLMSGLTGSGSGVQLKKRVTDLKISSPDFMTGAALTGGRSRASIQRVVMQNMAALRYAYNRRLRDKPGLQGKITVKFAIDEFGSVIFAQVVESTMADSELESTVVSRVKSWNFDKIDKPGDVTEVTYPFVFAM